MKKTVILIAAILMLVSPAIAQQAGRLVRAPQTNPTLAKLLNAYNRMNRANNQSAATAPSGQTKNPFDSLSNVNPTIPGSSPYLLNALTPPSNDRPFDANAPVIDPFAATTSPGSLSSPPFMPGPGVDPFSPSQLTVNPFIAAGPSLTTPFPANVPNVSANLVSNPGNPSPTGQNPFSLPKSSRLQLHPLEGLIQTDIQFTSSPYNAVSVFDPMASSGNPYALDYLFRGSTLRSPTSP